MFGKTARQWREQNPDLKGNIRDYASINELNMAIKHGKLKCCIYRTRYAAERAPCEAEPNSHSSNEHTGE